MLDTRNNGICKKAVEALRQRLGDDAVRYLGLRSGICLSGIEHADGFDYDKFVRLTKLPARTVEEFVIALTKEDAQDLPHWYGDAQAPLPDDLKAFSLEYELPHRDEDKEEDFKTLFEALGLFSLHDPGEITRFGEANTLRFRVDVVVTEKAIIESWGYKLNAILNSCAQKGLKLVHYHRTYNFAHRYRVGDEFVDLDCIDSIVEVYPEHPGEFERWARAVAKRTERWLTLHAACNGNFEEMLKVLKQKPAEAQQEMIVDGLVPRGVVTLLLARKGVGKTNALLELAVALAERRESWWGFKLHPGDGFIVFLLGEGSIAEATERVLMMNNGEWPMFLKLEKFNDSTMIEEIIANLKKSGIKVDLLIVDPGRKYYRGDEDSSDAVSEFFTKLEAFADGRNAGMIVSHHLKRDAHPKSIHDVPHWLRGSQVWIDRPRVILAMERRSNETTFGIPTPHGGDPLHNLRASTMFSDVLKLHRDEDTFTHVPAGKKKLAGSKQVEEPISEPTDDDRVFAALKRLLEEGKDVGASSKYELFLYKPEECTGMGRTEMRAAVQRLIDAGYVQKKVSGMFLPIDWNSRLQRLDFDRKG